MLTFWIKGSHLQSTFLKSDLRDFGKMAIRCETMEYFPLNSLPSQAKLKHSTCPPMAYQSWLFQIFLSATSYDSQTAHMLVHMILAIGGMCQNDVQHHAPLMTMILLSVYCVLLFYYVVWLHFLPVNFTFSTTFCPWTLGMIMFLTLLA